MKTECGKRLPSAQSKIFFFKDCVIFGYIWEAIFLFVHSVFIFVVKIVSFKFEYQTYIYKKVSAYKAVNVSSWMLPPAVLWSHLPYSLQKNSCQSMFTFNVIKSYLNHFVPKRMHNIDTEWTCVYGHILKKKYTYSRAGLG